MPRETKPKRELSDILYGSWEAVHHTIGSLIPPTLYVLGLKAVSNEPLALNPAETVAVGLAGSFALRYADVTIDFLLPEMKRESYIRRNQRELVRNIARAGTAVAAGLGLSYIADAPFIYTAFLSLASFAAGKKSSEKIPAMSVHTALPASAFLFASCLYATISSVANSTAIITGEFIDKDEQALHIGDVAPEPQIEYTAKPPFTVWPVASEWKQVNSCFGYRSAGRRTSVLSAHHRGIDIQAAWHTPVVSVGNGTVTEVRQKGGIVQIDHGEGIFTEYGHLDVIDVKPGDQLLSGEQIGLSGGRADGKNGPSTGPHLHFMVIDGGVSAYLQDTTGNAAVLKGKVNPLCYMDEEVGFSVSKKSGCNTQGGKNKYCGLYKNPAELVLDIEEQYGTIVTKHVDPAKFDPGLIYALIAQESRGNPQATNKDSGAAGLMQFTPDTGFRYGLCENKKCRGRDDRYDAEKNISQGVAYYERLYDEFREYTDGYIFALILYNQGTLGEKLVRKAIEKTELSDPTWEQVSVVITQDLVGDVYHTRSLDARERKALEIKDHVNNVIGYYSFYNAVRAGEAKEPGNVDSDAR